jgi:serine phosphatase RsbU (regulator of sigma subunit)
MERTSLQPPGRSPWDPQRPLPVPRFAVGTVAGLAAVVVIAAAVPDTIAQPSIPAGLMLLAVVLAAIVGGVAAGWIVLVASLGAFLYVFESPHDQFARHSFVDWAAIGTIAAVGFVLIVAVGTLRRSARLARLGQARLDVLLRVSSHFDDDLDPDAALRQIAAAAVPAFADHSVIDLLDDRGGFRRIVAADLDPLTAEYAANLERYPPEPGRHDHPSWQVVRTGKPMLVSSVDDAVRVAVTQSPEHLEIIRMLNRQSLLIVPIPGEGRPIGALTLAQRAASRRRFSKHDIPVAVELGIRAGSALQNAFAHAQVRDAFVDIQRQLLPRRLPAIDGVELGARYVPAGAASEAGGDWYGIVPISADRVGLAVGDMVGNGPIATAAMARARYGLLALAHRGGEPERVLTELNQLLFAVEASDILTVVYGILDLGQRRWTEARAGHMPTLLRAAGSDARVLDSKPGVPLGVLADAQYHQEEHEIGPGSMVALYTDGLVERRGEVLDVGIERLRSRLGDVGSDLDAACAVITHELVGDVPEDDVALLIARVGAASAAPDR